MSGFGEREEREEEVSVGRARADQRRDLNSRTS